MSNLLDAISDRLPQTKIDWDSLLNTPEQHYRIYQRKKSNGKLRQISAPQSPLRQIQRVILEDYLYQLSPTPCAHGFVPGRSIFTHAQHHIGQRWVIGLDIHRFFDMTLSTHAKTVFEQLPFLSPEDHTLLTQLCCFQGRLPQGAPTSPAIANLYFADADWKILSYALEHQLDYTRYADDLAFSGPNVPEGFVAEIESICQEYGYSLARRKTRTLGSGTRQMVTGLVVNRKLTVPKRYRRRFRAVVHNAYLNGLETALFESQLSVDSFWGAIRWIQSTHPQFEAEKIGTLKERYCP